MAIERNPNDPYSAANDEVLRRRAEPSDNDLQADPELADGPSSGGRIALFAIALVAVLGVVFYGLNNSSRSPEATPTAQTTPASPSPTGTAQAPRAPTSQTTGSSMRPAEPAPPAANNPAPAAPRNNAAPSDSSTR